jgi:ATP-binding protein involved in chromosome partitioning
MMDPRPAVIESRLSRVAAILPVSGGKGGIGKSVVSAGLALSLARSGRKVGLLDLDFSSPTQHVLLGADLGSFPAEDKGILPPRVHGIELMTMAYYSRNRPSPLRGGEFSNALLELLAVTLWGELDVLVVDMPPGLTDASLDVLRLMPRAKPLLVTIPSRLALETLRKVALMLGELRVEVLGGVENMRREPGPLVEDELRALGVPFLGAVPFDAGLEAALGDPERLAGTAAMRRLAEIAAKILGVPHG